MKNHPIFKANAEAQLRQGIQNVIEEEQAQGPRMAKPSFYTLKTAPTAAEQLAVEARQQIARQMIETRQMVQRWRQEPSKELQHIQRMLAKNPQLRAIVLGAGNQAFIPFMRLDDRQKLQLVRNAQTYLHHIARDIQSHIQNGIDPNDSTHLLNQADPNNLTNQFFATQQGVVQNQNQLNAEEIETENQAEMISQNVENHPLEKAEPITKEEITHHLTAFTAGLFVAQKENASDGDILEAIHNPKSILHPEPVKKLIEDERESHGHSLTGKNS